ncbi:MAG: hypothetical protein KTV45_09000 [Acidimicrobiia bacterium]|nr:hypothetical protein [Acidimicrobiia bacterium]
MSTPLKSDGNAYSTAANLLFEISHAVPQEKRYVRKTKYWGTDTFTNKVRNHHSEPSDAVIARALECLLEALIEGKKPSLSLLAKQAGRLAQQKGQSKRA